jgi:hypothetical protein
MIFWALMERKWPAKVAWQRHVPLHLLVRAGTCKTSYVGGPAGARLQIHWEEKAARTVAFALALALALISKVIKARPAK